MGSGNAHNSGSGAILREVCNNKARQGPPLLCVWNVCPQDGPPLSVGEQLCGLQQLQVFRPFPDVWTPLLPLCRPYKLEIFSSVLERCRSRSRTRPVPHSIPLLRLLHVFYLPLLPPWLSHTPGSKQLNYTGGIQGTSISA